MRELLREGWRPARILAGMVCGVVAAALAVGLFGDAGAAVFGVLCVVVFAAVLAFYVWSLLYVRFTARGRAMWAARRARERDG